MSNIIKVLNFLFTLLIWIPLQIIGTLIYISFWLLVGVLFIIWVTAVFLLLTNVVSSAVGVF